METFYGGNCLFEHRPLYFAARSHTHKLIWSEGIDPADGFSPDGPQLFDLTTDPGEQRNIHRRDILPCQSLKWRSRGAWPKSRK